MDNSYNSAMNRRKFVVTSQNDIERPRWHFNGPDGLGDVFDPNAAFFYGGRYHLMYLYRVPETGIPQWGHISSPDLLHWEHHPDAIVQGPDGSGNFSGGVYVEDDGTAYISFWKLTGKDNLGSIAIVKSTPPYDVWERFNDMAIPCTEWGVRKIKDAEGNETIVGCADPSNIWKEGDTYYLQTGNLCVLNAYGRAEDAPSELKGDWVDLFKSKDLKNWEYVHRFYKNPHLDDNYPDETEDDMCPSFFPLPDKKTNGTFTDTYLQLFIAHNKGAQYYTGAYDKENELFYPETHGRFSWVDNACFATEAMTDAKNRQLAWFWLLDNYPNFHAERGWSGSYTFPRTLWLENNVLHMAPADEIEDLYTDNQTITSFELNSSEKKLSLNNPRSFRLSAEIDIGDDTECAGFAVRGNEDERTEIYFDKKTNKLVFDATQSGPENWRHKEEAPFSLASGEKLKLDILLDNCIVEVYANNRQAITRRIFPKDSANSNDVIAFTRGGCAGFDDITVHTVDGIYE